LGVHGAGLKRELRGAKDTALRPRESSRKHRQIKILERFDSAESAPLGSLLAIAVNAHGRACKCGGDPPFRYVHFREPPAMFGTSAKGPAASSPPQRSGPDRAARRARDDAQCLHRAADAAGSSRMRSRRQPAFIDCH
jgi:hypothetical protein